MLAIREEIRAIETGEAIWPTFRDGHDVNRVIAAVIASSDQGAWCDISSI